MSLEMFNKQSAIEMHKKLNTLLKQFAEENGLTLEPSSAKFGSFEFSKKIKMKVASKAAVATDEMDRKFQFQRFAYKHGLNSGLYGQVVTLMGIQYRVTGVNTRKYRRPVELKRLRDNISCNCSPEFLKQAS